LGYGASGGSDPLAIRGRLADAVVEENRGRKPGFANNELANALHCCKCKSKAGLKTS